MKWRTVILYDSGHYNEVAEFEAVNTLNSRLDDGRLACNRDVGEVATWPELPDGTIVRALRDDGLVGRSITINRSPNPIFTTARAAEQLGISVRTVQQHVANLNLGQRIGRDVLLSPSDVQAIRERVGKVGRPPKHEATPGM